MDQLSHRYGEGGAGLREGWPLGTPCQAVALSSTLDPPTHCPSWGPFRAASTGSSRLRTILRMGHHQNPALLRVSRKQHPVTLFHPVSSFIHTLWTALCVCVCVYIHLILRYVFNIPSHFLTTGLEVHLLRLAELIKCAFGSYPQRRFLGIGFQ